MVHEPLQIIRKAVILHALGALGRVHGAGAMFQARMAGYDLLRAVQGLASRVTKWSTDCEKALHRLMCDVDCTIHLKMSGFIGDDIQQ